MKSRTERIRISAGRWAVAAVAIVLGLLAAEVAYRLVLFAREASDRSMSYRAFSDSIYEYDEALGYTYRPGASWFSMQVRDGVPAAGAEQESDSRGNIGSSGRAYAAADLQIVVVGDSFTANPDVSANWPEFLETALSQKLGRTVGVINAGRDGYGVLQMLDLAADLVPRLKPDILILAFIGNDLTRARFWRYTDRGVSPPRVIAVSAPLPARAGVGRRDVVLVDPRVTRSWFESLGPSPGRDDPVARELNARYRALRREALGSFYLLHPSRSFLFSRLGRGDPFRGVGRPSLQPRVEFEDFRDDAQAVARADALKRAGVRLLLVHLPTYPEVRAGAMGGSRQEERLWGSLQELLGARSVNLLAHLADHRHGADLLFLRRQDGHPSARGAELFGEAVAEELARSGVR